MDGITILAENTYRLRSVFEVVSSILIMCIGGGFAIVVSCGTESKWFVACISVIVCCILLTGVIQAFKVCNTFYTDFKVIVNESVSLKEFTNRYEIISQCGDIYTVREKEHVDETN